MQWDLKASKRNLCLRVCVLLSLFLSECVWPETSTLVMANLGALNVHSTWIVGSYWILVDLHTEFVNIHFRVLISIQRYVNEFSSLYLRLMGKYFRFYSDGWRLCVGGTNQIVSSHFYTLIRFHCILKIAVICFDCFRHNDYYIYLFRPSFAMNYTFHICPFHSNDGNDLNLI